MNKSLKDTLKISECLNAIAISATGSATGVDTAFGESLMFLVNAGEFDFSGSNSLDLVVQHADVDTDGSYADCVDADIFDAEDGANGIAKVLDSTDDKNAIHIIHYRGTKRYVRVRYEETGTVSVPLSIVAVQGHLKANPAS